MEPEARRDFERKVGTAVTQVGLVISPFQPWLCASPDGLFETSSGVTLLEIKCPYSRKDDTIIDHVSQQSYVNYIVYEDGSLKVARSHQYYCQMQVAMYVTNTKECFFFVYSRKQSIIVVVERDEDFLSVNIPKLESFFYLFYMKQLMK
uniref:Protein containing YqaJ domain n=1 Tax=Rhipicephalus zambeziensis TaxID=60191 RepID=A0A224YYM8_9ACAR